MFFFNMKALRFLIIASLLLIPLATSKLVLAQSVTISLDPSITYQTITGWSATAQAGETECSGYDLYQNDLFNMAADDLGISRLHVSIRSGVENTRDYYAEFLAGQMDYDTYRSLRFWTVNDNEDPYTINWDGYHFAFIDTVIEKVYLPMKQRVEANGEKPFLNVTYTAFTRQIDPSLSYIHDDPQEYAEFVLATYLHLQEKYGLVPDAWEILLEPDNVPQWNGSLIGKAIVASAQRLQEHGFTPVFAAPSTTSMQNASLYFDAMVSVPGAVDYVRDLVYHRYRDVSVANLRAIADRAARYNVNSAMLEHIGSGYQDLHEDLKIGMNTSWQQFALAFCDKADKGRTYYLIDDSNPAIPKLNIGSRTKLLRQYFKFIRPGAVRFEARSDNVIFDPLAFVNPNGGYVLVVNAQSGGSFVVRDLPEGIYGIKYSTPKEYDMNLPDISLAAGQVMQAEIPYQGVITIYLKSAPTPTSTPSFTPTIANTATQALPSAISNVQQAAVIQASPAIPTPTKHNKPPQPAPTQSNLLPKATAGGNPTDQASIAGEKLADRRNPIGCLPISTGIVVLSSSLAIFRRREH